MIVIKNVQQPNGKVEDVKLSSLSSRTIDGHGLTILPALIDPHVHFRIPGAGHKENWILGANAAIRSGITTVIDMPNNIPSCTSLERLLEKHQLIQQQIKASEIPLRYYLYFGADRNHLKEIAKTKDHAIGIKVFMGSSTGDLLIDDAVSLDEVFRIAADNDMLISVHAEDEEIIRQRKSHFGHSLDPSTHSKVRCRTAALKAVKIAIYLAAKYKVRLCILHVSTKEELEIIRQAKASGLRVYAEVTPHHLLLSTADYIPWGTLVQVNPPLRESEDQAALWQGIKDGTIDFIGTDHAPHTLEEKNQPYGKCPSGIPSIELLLPLMLDAVNEGKLDLTTLIKLTSTNIATIFRLPAHNDVVLVRHDLKRAVRDEDLRTKCQWSPYTGRLLTGWPIYTIIQGNIFQLN
jgi:dihydroorotase